MPVPAILRTPQQPTDHLVRYTVVASIPKGKRQRQEVEVEVPSFNGPGPAARRAHITLVASGYGDLDTVTVERVLDESGAQVLPLPN